MLCLSKNENNIAGQTLSVIVITQGVESNIIC